MSAQQATLLFDGACGICRSWVAYWRGLTGDCILYRPYQDAAAEFPAIAREDLAHAIFLIEPDGQVFSGAAATFRVLRIASQNGAAGRGLWWWAYAHLPGFAGLSERGYGFFARRRGLLALATRLLWGKSLEIERSALISFVFLRLFGAIVICAFLSLKVQILGLVGHDGLLPLAPYLAAAHHGWGASAYWRLPTIFWADPSDLVLQGAAIAGAVCGLFILCNLYVRAALAGAFVLYLSLTYAGQIFMNYQWDQLLVETSFLAIFLTVGSRIVVFLFRCLVFRFLFLSGATKLLSGDPGWWHLSALDTHLWTQPLPAPLAWPASRLPHAILHAGTAATLVIELVLPFLIFLPRRPRMFAGFCVLVFQALIIATGNFNFFNLLTMLLCLFFFDDQALRPLFPRRLAGWIMRRASRPGGLATVIAVVLALFILPMNLDRLWRPFAHADMPIVGILTNAVSPWLIVNSYGLFMTSTTTRPEIVIQGSQDGQSWRDYVFDYYPGPPARAPCWNIPHQPRLDWQMWFAAYGNAASNPWFVSLLRALLENRQPVLALMDGNPFPGNPPRYVRAELFDYRFAPESLKARTGQWWERRLAGLYFPQVSLADLKPALPPPHRLEIFSHSGGER
ncbi:MAG: DUF393 domain-containing protein [Beijerinckiaceae bacterium]|nr:MAG: DUF393 domain-containing protein [Beijerinckiaceae bacterium]